MTNYPFFSGVFPSNSTPSLVTMETNCSGDEFHLLSCYNPPGTPTQPCATGTALWLQCRGECVCVYSVGVSVYVGIHKTEH